MVKGAMSELDIEVDSWIQGGYDCWGRWGRRRSGSRMVCVVVLPNLWDRAVCNGVVSLRKATPEELNPRDEKGRFRTARNERYTYLDRDVSQPGAKVYYHIDLSSDKTFAEQSIVTDGENEYYEVNWNGWRENFLDWRLVSKRTCKDYLTQLDIFLIKKAIEGFWKLNGEQNG